MKIRRKPEIITTKGLIAAGVVLVVLIAVGLIGWSLMATNAEQDFAARFTEAKKSILDELNDKTTQLQGLTQAGDTGKTADFLAGYASAVDADVVNIPAQTYFAGLPLVGDARVQIAADLKAKLDDLASTLHESASILAYQFNILQPLLAAKNIVSSDLKEEQQMAQSWRNLENQLSGMQVPDSLHDLHATIFNLVSSTRQALEALPTATQKHDQKTQQAIAGAISGYLGQIQHLGPTVQEISKTTDEKFNAAYQSVHDALQ